MHVAVMPSIRRPCMVRALLSSGVTRRWLVKRDQLLHDRAASRLLPAAAIPGSPPSLYNVTLLSEDCGLIEYLEGHHSIRSLAAKSCDLDNLGVSRPLDADLLAEPPSRLALTHERFCGKVPATALRSAFQELCCTSEDFIRRKKRFQDSLATITIFNWIFDVGDRHMENFLVEAGTGALCCIDWGSTMQRRQLSEPPPARLTRNMLAMCDPIVNQSQFDLVPTQQGASCDFPALEGRLQTALTQLRDSRETFLATARLLYARSPACQPQLSHLKAILEGRVTSADIRVEANPDPDLDRLQALLLQVFPGRPAVDTYSVKDQVKVLLRHCTDPRVLGATRAGWEPWL